MPDDGIPFAETYERDQREIAEEQERAEATGHPHVGDDVAAGKGGLFAGHPSEVFVSAEAAEYDTGDFVKYLPHSTVAEGIDHGESGDINPPGAAGSVGDPG